MLFALMTLAAGEAYQWPLTLPPAVTSSFAEYRAGRFHAGLDLRTGGIGPEVYAAADGYISRIRCSPWGYGKAVYLQAGDGHMFVYAHLAEFAGGLRDYVRHAQHAHEKYSIDLQPEPGAFPVRRGDLLAFAGRTGTRAPHLHWEFRDAQSQPLNPRLLGIAWPDNTRPRIRKVLLVPAEAGATLNGDLVPVVLEVRPDGNDGEHTCATVTARGKIGIAVDVIDPANAGTSVLGIHTLRTIVDARETFRVQNDVLSYETMGDGSVSWHPYYRSEGPFLLQWRWEGNQSPNFSVSETDGRIEAGDKPLNVLIEACDYFGNTATLPLRLEPEAAEPPAPPSRGSNAPGTLSIDCFDQWLLITAQFPDDEPEAPMLQSTGTEPEPVFQRVGAGLFRAGIRAAKHSDQVALVVEHPRLAPYAETLEVFQRGRGRIAYFGDLVLRADARSAYGTLGMRLSEEAVAATSGLVAIGKGYRLWPSDAPLDVPLEVSFPEPGAAADAANLSIYRKSGSGWARQETLRGGGRLTIRTRSLGLFAPMVDPVAPSITRVLPAADAGSTTNRRPRIQACVTDNASGVETVRITANGAWLLSELDPFDSPSATVTWQQDEDLPLGENVIVIQATDAAGNTAEVTRTIHVIEDLSPTS